MTAPMPGSSPPIAFRKRIRTMQATLRPPIVLNDAFGVLIDALPDVRCPFLALSVQQRAANGSKRRHKAKAENVRS